MLRAYLQLCSSWLASECDPGDATMIYRHRTHSLKYGLWDPDATCNGIWA
jgi:hypothetical protein